MANATGRLPILDANVEGFYLIRRRL